MRKTTGLFFAAILLPVMLAGYEGTLIGGEPYEKWEKGGNDYFVMFNSLIDDQVTLFGEGEDRQGDTCLLESSFTLSNFHTPDDAVIAKAYLIWMGAVDPTKFAAPTDNALFLNFTRYDGNYTQSEEIIAGDEAKMLGDTTDPFLFQSVRFTTDVATGCTETEAGTTGSAEIAYFTYRKDVTAFFEKIWSDNNSADNPLLDGDALYGAYTVSGLDCTDHDNYKCRGMMVSNWSLFFVYNSGMISDKRIYLYPGFASMQGEAETANVSGFRLPKEPFARLTVVTAEGDRGLARPESPPESVYIRGEAATTTYTLTNECNPYVAETMNYEIYNGVSSVYGWNQDENPEPICVTGGYGEQKQGIDVDTFLLNPQDDINLQEHLKKDITALDVTLSVNQDAILVNYLVFARDAKQPWPSFDIPPEATDWPNGREKHFCGCPFDEDSYCSEQPITYLIKVQNWGFDLLEPVKDIVVVDDLPPEVDYITGTTEMASEFDEKGAPVGWTTVPDLPGGVFPLSGEGYKVADTLAECDYATWTCADTRVLRFKVMPKKGLKKYMVIENTAFIKDAWGTYATNYYVPLSLAGGNCAPISECEQDTAFIKWCGGECLGCTDDDIVTADADDIVPDETTDTDTKKDGGCGCSLVW